MKTLVFDNRFVRELPSDPETGPHTRQIQRACYSRVTPSPVRSPRLLAWSPEMAHAIGLTEEDVLSPLFTEVFSGNRLLPGMEPYASCYGGHQFGHWAGQLGDGRAISLGETIAPNGARWELQLKGAGLTPYSRSADGRAVLRSSVREFLCSEAMHHLGIPTTRALSLISTGEPVLRDLFYDGHPREEPGAVICRMAPSFIRFGHFEILCAREEIDLLEKLVDFTIARDFPELQGTPATRRTDWFTDICRRTALLLVDWMRVGFVHGVMNTDNMSIMGLTIDYGPYGWIDHFDLDWTPNTTDANQRRYRFGHQPTIAHWNLWQLANALHPLFGDPEPLEAGLACYAETFEKAYKQMMANKIGLPAERDETLQLTTALHDILQNTGADMTLFFRTLADVTPDLYTLDLFEKTFYTPLHGTVRTQLANWLTRYAQQIAQDQRPAGIRRTAMNAVNPVYILRNYLAQEAIDAAENGDPGLINTLLDVVRTPYDPRPEYERFAAKRPEWAEHKAGCSMLSCSS